MSIDLPDGNRIGSVTMKCIDVFDEPSKRRRGIGGIERSGRSFFWVTEISMKQWEEPLSNSAFRDRDA